jgi:hypothetical protein
MTASGKPNLSRISYRAKRRAFLAGLGGAFGLGTLLENLEASAEGSPSPPRLLVVHWPLGTLRYRFLPQMSGSGFTTSPILAPFDAAGLHDDMIVLYGLSHNGMTGMGGGNEDGTVFAVTGASSPGTRINGGEYDDGVAGGPSFDQIFRRHVPELALPSPPVNAAADARVFSEETSTRCLSYSYEKVQVDSARPGGFISENRPVLATLSPHLLYGSLFSGLMPGGDPAALTRSLRLRKSVLDSALRELSRVHDLAPASEWEKLDMHADAIRRLELELEDALEESSNCTIPESPEPSFEAKGGSSPIHTDPVSEEDASFVEQVGKLHARVILAAFQCDLARVATLQWCPGTNHVAMAGMDPEDPAAVYEMGSFHYGLPFDQRFFASPSPASMTAQELRGYDTLSNMFTWFSRVTADVLRGFKDTLDLTGRSLLDSTIVPYITEQADPSDARSPLPAVIFGGRALGMRGGQFMNFSPIRHHNDLWMTVAQAYLKTDNPLAAFSDEVFVKTNVAPISGLWAPPA